MGQTITKLNTHTITNTKALSNTQGLFLCLTNNNTMSHTKIRINTITMTKINTKSHTKIRINTITMTKINTKSHTNTLRLGITNSPTMESPPWEFGPYVGI